MNTVTSLLRNYILIKARGEHDIETSKQSFDYALSLCSTSIFKVVVDLSEVTGRITNVDRFNFIAFASEKVTQIEQVLNIKLEIIFLLQHTEIPPDNTSQRFADLLNLNIRYVDTLDDVLE